MQVVPTNHISCVSSLKTCSNFVKALILNRHFNFSGPVYEPNVFMLIYKWELQAVTSYIFLVQLQVVHPQHCTPLPAHISHIPCIPFGVGTHLEDLVQNKIRHFLNREWRPENSVLCMHTVMWENLKCPIRLLLNAINLICVEVMYAPG